MIPLPSWEMITIQNFRMFPGFLLVVLPLLWLGSCVLTWIVLFVPFSQPNILGESVKAVFSLFSPFFSVAILVIMLNIWFGRRIYEVRNGWLHTEKGYSASVGMLLIMIRIFCRNAPWLIWMNIRL